MYLPSSTVTIHTIKSNVNKTYILSSERDFAVWDLRTNSDYFYEGEEECLLRGTNWVFKNNRPTSTFRRLIRVAFNAADNTTRDYVLVNWKKTNYISCNVLAGVAYCIEFCVNLQQTQTECHRV